MQCFICVTYMIILCSGSPTKNQEIATTHEKRSLFRDVIESLRIHSQIPEDLHQNDDNDLSQNYESYGYDQEPQHLPSDVEYIPRRNDRLEMPSLKYRFPKNLNINSTDNEKSREEVVVMINNSNRFRSTTQKPKGRPQQRPNFNKNKYGYDKNKQSDDENHETETPNEDFTPLTNTMAGQSQIGHRESQTVVKPTVIVNIRGSVSHKDSDIRIEGRDNLDNITEPIKAIFNINQEVNFDRATDPKKSPNVKQEIRLIPEKGTPKAEEDICETATWKSEDADESRKFDSVLQILFSF